MQTNFIRHLDCCDKAIQYTDGQKECFRVEVELIVKFSNPYHHLVAVFGTHVLLRNKEHLQRLAQGNCLQTANSSNMGFYLCVLVDTRRIGQIRQLRHTIVTAHTILERQGRSQFVAIVTSDMHQRFLPNSLHFESAKTETALVWSRVSSLPRENIQIVTWRLETETR